MAENQMMKIPYWKIISVILLLAATAAAIFASNSEQSIRVKGIQYLPSPDSEEDVATVIGRPFQPIEGKTIPPFGESIWLKIPVPSDLREWDDGAVLFTGSNEVVLSMQAYLVTGKKIEDLGYCDARLEAPTCKISTLQYAFKIDAADIYDQTFLYLKILPGFNGVQNEFYFMEPGYFNKVTVFIVYFIGIGSGLSILTIILAFVFFFSFMDYAFLFYGLLYICLLIIAAINRGIYDLFRPIDWFAAANIILPTHYCIFVFDLLFVKMFFESHKRDKAINVMLNAAIAILLMSIALTQVFSLKVLMWNTLPYGVLATQLVQGIALVYFIYKKRDWAIPFGLAWSMVIIYTLLWNFYRTGQIEGTWYFGYYVFVGRIMEILILNYVLYGKLKVVVTQIIRARAKAEESRIVKTLLRTLSHDLSSTTQVIQLGATISKGSNNKDDIDRNLDTILAAAKAQSDIISQAKNNYLVKPNEVINLSSVDIKKCINETTTLFGYRCKKKNIDLVVEVDDNDVFVSGEATCLTHQILGNLVSNSLKFTSPGKKIFIKAKCLDDKTVRLTVQDEGIGMTPEMVAHLFEDHNISRPGTLNEEGTGHGLQIVRDFVKALGATIIVESKLGTGTTMTMDLRRAI